MLSIDSCTLAIPRDMVDIVDPSYFRTITDSTGVIILQQAKALNYFGLNSITVEYKIIRILISAKILGNDYMQGINIHTIETVITLINKSNIIKLKTVDPKDFEVHHCDVVANYRIEEGERLTDYFYALNLIHNPKYTTTPYKSNNILNGVSFNTKSKKGYFNCYDKYREMHLSKNRGFVQLLGENKVYSDCYNVIRIECRMSSFTKIRTEFASTTNTLSNILNSTANPLDATFSGILAGRVNGNNLKTIANMNSIQDFKDMCISYGINAMIKKEYNNNPDDFANRVIPSLTKDVKASSNKSRVKKACRQLIQNAIQTAVNQLNFSPSQYIDKIGAFLNYTYNYSIKAITN